MILRDVLDEAKEGDYFVLDAELPGDIINQLDEIELDYNEKYTCCSGDKDKVFDYCGDEDLLEEEVTGYNKSGNRIYITIGEFGSYEIYEHYLEIVATKVMNYEQWLDDYKDAFKELEDLQKYR